MSAPNPNKQPVELNRTSLFWAEDHKLQMIRAVGHVVAKNRYFHPNHYLLIRILYSKLLGSDFIVQHMTEVDDKSSGLTLPNETADDMNKPKVHADHPLHLQFAAVPHKESKLFLKYKDLKLDHQVRPQKSVSYFQPAVNALDMLSNMILFVPIRIYF